MLALWRTSALNPVLALKRHLGLYETLGDIPKRHGCSYRNHFLGKHLPSHHFLPIVSQVEHLDSNTRSGIGINDTF